MTEHDGRLRNAPSATIVNQHPNSNSSIRIRNPDSSIVHMPRTLTAAILGWLALVAMVLLLFSLGYAVLGADSVFQPVSFDVTRMWSFVGIGLNLVAAIIAGVVCVSAGGDTRSVRILAVMVLLFGLLMAVQSLNAPDNPAGLARLGPVPTTQAMIRAHQPMWATIVNPIVTVFGVIIGAMIWRKPTS